MCSSGHPDKEGTVLCTFYKWGNCGTEKLNNLPRLKQSDTERVPPPKWSGFETSALMSWLFLKLTCLTLFLHPSDKQMPSRDCGIEFPNWCDALRAQAALKSTEKLSSPYPRSQCISGEQKVQGDPQQGQWCLTQQGPALCHELGIHSVPLHFPLIFIRNKFKHTENWQNLWGIPLHTTQILLWPF